jgi:hypothetical protein
LIMEKEGNNGRSSSQGIWKPKAQMSADGAHATK